MADRLDAYSIPEPNSGCLLWFGNERAGYGRVPVCTGSNKKKGAHVAAWELYHGRSVPEGMDVLHKCDVAGCIEPTHLFLGTHDDNMADKVAKGRAASMPGSQHPCAKLTEAKVARILVDPRTLKALAAEHNVSESTISLIRRRKTWRHVA